MSAFRLECLVVRIGNGFFWPMCLSECYMQAYTFAKLSAEKLMPTFEGGSIFEGGNGEG